MFELLTMTTFVDASNQPNSSKEPERLFHFSAMHRETKTPPVVPSGVRKTL